MIDHCCQICIRRHPSITSRSCLPCRVIQTVRGALNATCYSTILEPSPSSLPDRSIPYRLIKPMNQDEDFAAAAIEIIQKRWPRLWEALEKAQPYTEVLLVQDRPSATLVAGGIQLASAYDPLAEARLQIGEIPQGITNLWLYGVGMGYLPRLVLPELSPHTRLNVVPLNLALFKELLYWVDQSDWLGDERVHFHLPTSKTRPQTHYVVTTPCLCLADDRASVLRDRLTIELNQDSTEQNLDWFLKKMVVKNMADNASLMQMDGDVGELFDSLKRGRVPAVVVGAGPSLDEQMGVIHRLQNDRAVVICVDAALSSLLAGGINPQLVVTQDHRQSVRKFFSADLSALKDSKLVYFPGVDHEVLLAWPHRRLTAYSREQHYTELKKEFPKQVLFASGSVIHPAVDLAVRMGAPRICLAGADFSYPGSRTHSKDVPWAKELGTDERSGNMARWVVNGYGERVQSSVNLIAYLRDLEDYIRLKSGTCFINLGRKGANITGVTYLENQA